MSIENVNQFYQVVSQDPELQLQFQFATDEENLVNMAVELGQQHGYSFTKEEVIQAIALAQPFTETTGMVELADEQLEAVAGGFWWAGVPVFGLLGISALQIVQLATGQEKSPGASRAAPSGFGLNPKPESNPPITLGEPITLPGVPSNRTFTIGY
ncbi:hypothetical protein DSM106972_048370 [Dulcicalothrix desertica PCC 7102]|uniref:Nif11 domain-containing protein n=1 Tax=Dulcicalothrix desertica PCC 7102 TaxID=232991 RepID=A0A3S1ALI6_9CYAN|nr:Nif11-like leader peptide family natural product precursor [Dulcicalothrix desertica]RUT03923.1 hypothetical protein DSM106972_048370 [Dulcicalothrix desertica PCC 7102]TWH43669.1 putative ribosomally synthesized peptide with nif11-like leader [Dulcicalothrix desertica PCC 7102]